MIETAFELTADEAVVVLGVLDREADRRAGAGLAAALVDPGEWSALHVLGEVLRKSIPADPASHRFRSQFSAARRSLTPAPDETALIVPTAGTDIEPLPPPANAADCSRTAFVLPADAAVVLYEWFLREIDEREAANLLPALVTMGEFWALKRSPTCSRR